MKHSSELIDEAITTTRSISNNLMPRVIKDYGISKALNNFCEKITKTGKVEISMKLTDLKIDDKNIEIVIFRVVTKLINNTIKHAEANCIKITLKQISHKLKIVFIDDGVGFEVKKTMESEDKGMGLQNIISRIKSINGDCIFNSKIGAGTTIST